MFFMSLVRACNLQIATWQPTNYQILKLHRKTQFYFFLFRLKTPVFSTSRRILKTLSKNMNDLHPWQWVNDYINILWHEQFAQIQFVQHREHKLSIPIKKNKKFYSMNIGHWQCPTKFFFDRYIRCPTYSSSGAATNVMVCSIFLLANQLNCLATSSQ